MSALLLRLFQSEHFSLQLAVSYLRNYADSIGVTAYLVGRLTEFPDAELEFYWPQLCHLLVTQPTGSVALENLIMRRCDASTHIAMLTLWYLQASLADLQKTPTSPAFHICRRALNRIQSNIFSDHLSPQDESAASALGIEEVAKILAHAQPVFAGIGLVASSIAMPALSNQTGAVVLAQGRRQIEQTMQERRQSMDAAEEYYSSSDEDGHHEEAEAPPQPVIKTPVNPKQLNGVAAPSVKREPSYAPGRPLLLSESSPVSLSSSRSSMDHLRPRRPMPASQSASALSPRQKRTSPSASPLHRSQRPSNVDLSASKRAIMAQQPATAALPKVTWPQANFGHPQSASVPVLSLGSMSTSSTSFGASQMPDYVHLANALPRALLVKLLRSYACRTQLDLLTSLQDISTRLVLVPKPARISALRAELTVLNHRLPRGCCLCLGCPGEGRHHRVIRISPSEAVVLNSADRAPFLLQVEILEEDLDFEPARRQNGEDLRTVLDEREAAAARQSYRSAHPLPKRKNSEPVSAGVKFANAFNDSLNTAIREMKSKFAPDAEEADAASLSPKSKSRSRQVSESTHHTIPYQSAFLPAASPPSVSRSVMESPSPAPLAHSNEEVDLVEQLYGDMSMHDAMPIIDEEGYIAPAIQNRSVDEEAWTRASPLIATSAKLKSPRPSVTAEHIDGLGTSSETAEDRHALTLDEYAERMRMAAVMLAQLSASQQPVIGLRGQATELVGAGVGLGAGLVGAALGRLPFVSMSPSASDNTGGQGAAGVAAKIDASHATSGGVDVSSPRHRVLSPQDAAAIRERIMREMMELETERMERMRLDSRRRTAGWITSTRKAASDLESDDAKVVRQVVSKDDPSSAVLRESWPDKRARIRAASPYGHLAAWDLISVIVKTGADLRQEQLAVQLIREFGRIWAEASCPHWIRYFRILVTSDSTGLMETITDAVSVHSIKKAAYAAATMDLPEGAEQQPALATFTLYDHFVETYGEPGSSAFRKAQDCFMKSLASYSVISYLLQIKDRHNGNILIDKDGHIIHIDFGFLLSNSPGSLGFEMAPFKLPQDYIDILGGLGSERFAEWRKLVKRCFFEVRRQAERLIMLVELMQKDSNLPCFSSGEQTAQLLRERFQLSLTRGQCDDFVDRLIDTSALSVFTRLYDAFQSYSQGIL